MEFVDASYASSTYTDMNFAACSTEQSDSPEWGMEGQWVDNAIWADTVTRSTLAELWSHRGHVATSAHTAQGAGEQ